MSVIEEYRLFLEGELHRLDEEIRKAGKRPTDDYPTDNVHITSTYVKGRTIKNLLDQLSTTLKTYHECFGNPALAKARAESWKEKQRRPPGY